MMADQTDREKLLGMTDDPDLKTKLGALADEIEKVEAKGLALDTMRKTMVVNFGPGQKYHHLVETLDFENSGTVGMFLAIAEALLKKAGEWDGG